ncbi:hypothetical protein [Streptomyces sp. NPDC040750]|uniref:hypothetical protein n=1 Tax=Streptomyces sp. NPDC040750 TaxID=3154491 RepID=UPI003411E1F6
MCACPGRGAARPHRGTARAGDGSVAGELLVGVCHIGVVDGDSMSVPPVLFAFIAATARSATRWRHRFRRGPLEHALDLATRPARHVR